MISEWKLFLDAEHEKALGKFVELGRIWSEILAFYEVAMSSNL